MSSHKCTQEIKGDFNCSRFKLFFKSWGNGIGVAAYWAGRAAALPIFSKKEAILFNNY